MNKKQFRKKLSLNKTTVTDLSAQEQGNVKGGGTYASCYFTCEPCGNTMLERTCLPCPFVQTVYESCMPWDCDGPEY